MNTHKKIIYIILFSVVFQLDVFSQNDSIYRIYAGQEEEIIIIENNSFKIISDRLSLEVDRNDPVIAYGDVKFLNNDFVEFNSVNYNKNAVQRGVIFI
jgi:hypothetical protein